MEFWSRNELEVLKSIKSNFSISLSMIDQELVRQRIAYTCLAVLCYFIVKLLASLFLYLRSLKVGLRREISLQTYNSFLTCKTADFY